MANEQPTTPVITRGPRMLFFAFAILTFLALVAMYVLAEQTELYFAWTIQPPITSAFLGAGYAAGLAGVVVSLLRREWSYALISFEAIFVFVTVTTAATLLHLDKFHFGATGIPLFAAWAWLVVYLAVPGWIAVVMLQQRVLGRSLGPAVLPPPSALVLLVVGVLLGVIGVALFVAPGTADVLWPWNLTPLTARTVAAWLLTLTVMALRSSRAGDVAFLEGPATGTLALAILYTVALVRFSDQVNWDRPAAWIFLLLLAILAVTGAVGVVYTRRGRQDLQGQSESSR